MTALALALDRRGRLTWPALAGVGTALGLMLAPAGVDGPTICPFALLTGHACPGCGMTRAMVALAHGDLALSWAYHPLALVVGLELMVAYGWWVGIRAGVISRRPGRAVTVILTLSGAALLAVWLVRMAAGTLPPV